MDCPYTVTYVEVQLIFVVLLLLMLLDNDSNTDLTIVTIAPICLCSAGFLEIEISPIFSYFLTARYLLVCNFLYLLATMTGVDLEISKWGGCWCWSEFTLITS